MNSDIKNLLLIRGADAAGCHLQSVIDALYVKVEAEEQRRALEKKQAAAAAPKAPAGAAAGPALATA